MMKLRSKILAGVGVAAVAGAVAAAGLTSASASPAAGAASSGVEYFQLMTTSAAPAAPGSIIARGSVFTAGGVNHPGSTVDTAVFPDGTFEIAHSNGTGTPRFNPKTCLAVITLNGTYQVGHGTGAYAGISGHGIYRLNIVFVAARNSAGNCSNKLPPVAFQQIIKAQGPVSL
jgi:hypothetical protein